MTKVIHTFDYATLNVHLRGPNGGVYRDLLRRALRVQAVAKHNVKADHGRLRNSIHIGTRVGEEGAFVIEIGSDLEYALMVHNGTGIYGPHGTRIVPTHGSVLVFPLRASMEAGSSVASRRGRIVFARSVAGQPANHYLSDALNAAVRG